VANRPLGPAKIDPSALAAEIGKESELYYSSKPIAWPELRPARPVAAPAPAPLAPAGIS
jgi:hypothetical protein